MFFFALFYKSNYEATKDTFLVDWFLSNLAHLRIRDFVVYLSLKFGNAYAESKGVMNDNIAKNCSKSLRDDKPLIVWPWNSFQKLSLY